MKLKYIFPFALLFALLIMLYHELFYARPGQLPSALIGTQLPYFDVADLNHPQQRFTAAQLKGRVSLLNVWATWCDACAAEHPMLMKISTFYHIPLYSI